MSKKILSNLFSLSLLTFVFALSGLAQAQSVTPRVQISKPPVEETVSIVTTSEECEEIYLANREECPSFQETLQQFQRCENYEASNLVINCRKKSLQAYKTCHTLISEAYDQCLEQVEQIAGSEQAESPVLSPVTENNIKD